MSRVLITVLLTTLPVVLVCTPLLLLCVFVPFVGFLTLPSLLTCAVYILFGTTWLAYLLLAPRAKLPYSPKRCYKVCRGIARCALEAWKLNLGGLAMDWSYRRVMVLGSKTKDQVIRENISYGSIKGNKTLDVYLPPSSRRNSSATEDGGESTSSDTSSSSLAPVIVLFAMSGWGRVSDKRYYVQIALTLRKKGIMVVVPDITGYPHGKAHDMVADIRRVLAWTGKNASRYGGDANAIHIMGHGSGAHLSLLTIVQEGIVRSRDALWFSSYAKEAIRERARSKTPNAFDDESMSFDGGSPEANDYDSKAYPASGATSEVEVSAGIRRLEIWGGEEVELPRIKGMILMACISDVIKHTRNQYKQGLEQLSPLRKALGPSHAQCLMASPSHLLFGAKQVVNPKLLPPNVLLIHGGQDQSVPIVQSVLLKTLLQGVGVSNVIFRAYRDLSHLECLTALCGPRTSKYSSMIVNEIVSLVQRREQNA